ncbi:MAG: hypothetical protein JWN32_1632 [Solirubrobacterales bacterium]|nr:hypothetical protein [Solirubrobacterales bacterium]
MRSRIIKPLLALGAVAALAVPAVVQARQGADDPAGHVRHGAGEVHHRHHHAAHHGRHGADDGPNHR